MRQLQGSRLSYSKRESGFALLLTLGVILVIGLALYVLTDIWTARLRDSRRSAIYASAKDLALLARREAIELLASTQGIGLYEDEKHSLLWQDPQGGLVDLTHKCEIAHACYGYAIRDLSQNPSLSGKEDGFFLSRGLLGKVNDSGTWQGKINLNDPNAVLEDARVSAFLEARGEYKDKGSIAKSTLKDANIGPVIKEVNLGIGEHVVNGHWFYAYSVIVGIWNPYDVPLVDLDLLVEIPLQKDMRLESQQEPEQPSIHRRRGVRASGVGRPSKRQKGAQEPKVTGNGASVRNLVKGELNSESWEPGQIRYFAFKSQRPLGLDVSAGLSACSSGSMPYFLVKPPGDNQVQFDDMSYEIKYDEAFPWLGGTLSYKNTKDGLLSCVKLRDPLPLYSRLQVSGTLSEGSYPGPVSWLSYNLDSRDGNYNMRLTETLDSPEAHKSFLNFKIGGASDAPLCRDRFEGICYSIDLDSLDHLGLLAQAPLSGGLLAQLGQDFWDRYYVSEANCIHSAGVQSACVCGVFNVNAKDVAEWFYFLSSFRLGSEDSTKWQSLAQAIVGKLKELGELYLSMEGFVASGVLASALNDVPEVDLSQGELLDIIGDALSVSSDTFLVYSWGESSDEDQGLVSSAVFASIVQRVPTGKSVAFRVMHQRELTQFKAREFRQEYIVDSL